MVFGDCIAIVVRSVKASDCTRPSVSVFFVALTVFFVVLTFFPCCRRMEHKLKGIGNTSSSNANTITTSLD